MSVQRYDVGWIGDSEGLFVKHSAYAALEARNAELEAERDALRARADAFDALCDEIEAIENDLWRPVQCFRSDEEVQADEHRHEGATRCADAVRSARAALKETDNG